MQNDELFIYKDFVLQGKVQNFISLNWVRRFNGVGEFTLTLQLTKQNIELIRLGDIIYKGNDGEAAFIEDVVSDEDESGGATLTVTGRFLNSLLDRRVITYATTTNVKTIINSIVTQNFISASNQRRNISFLRILDYTLTNNLAVAVEFNNENALEIIQKLCKDNNVGFKIMYNPHRQSFDFTLYEGKRTPAEFSENYKNIKEQDYYYQTTQHKNVCLIDHNNQINIYGDANAGINRREIFTSGNTKSLDSATEQARLYLLGFQIVEAFDTVINSKSPQFVYKVDWELGDIVTNQSDLWNLTIERNVLEVTEYFDASGTNLSLIFGDMIPTKI